MTTHRTLHGLALASLAALTATPALAQDSYYLFGLGGGVTHSQFDERRSVDGLLGGSPAITDFSNDRNDRGFKVFGGRQFNRYFGVEAGFFQLGRNKYSATTSPAGTVDGRLRVQGGNVDAVLTLPMTDSLSVLARAGATYAKSRNTYNTTGAATLGTNSASQRETNPKIGVGLQYEFSKSLLVRGEVERYRTSDALGHRGNIDLMSVSLVFPFGRSAAPAPRAAAPMYVPPVAMAAPEPVPVAVAPLPRAAEVVAFAPPTPAPRRRVSFSAESLFGFDKSAMRPEGKTALDGFIKELDGTEYVSIGVEGHTDRLGSTAYNQTLSQERADAVKAYLVASGRIDAAKVSTSAKSESDPVTKPEDCKGSTPSAKLIACLQPDRRVEIEVIGTR